MIFTLFLFETLHLSKEKIQVSSYQASSSGVPYSASLFILITAVINTQNQMDEKSKKNYIFTFMILMVTIQIQFKFFNLSDKISEF